MVTEQRNSFLGKRDRTRRFKTRIHTTSRGTGFDHVPVFESTEQQRAARSARRVPALIVRDDQHALVVIGFHCSRY